MDMLRIETKGRRGFLTTMYVLAAVKVSPAEYRYIWSLVRRVDGHELSH